ncbi:MAG: hypothetical protein Q4E57_07260 [Eubacteriales bacterium]|nr:hypothetical protein [Eubacteriales bacterium]
MKKSSKLFDIGTKYTPKLLDVLEKFGLGPALSISGIERDILDVISQIEDAGFYDLCECFDMKPSKMEKFLLDLEDSGLVEYMDAAGKVLLTDLAVKYIELDKKETKAEKKFRKFIECLNDDELDRFMVLADSFEIDESLLTPADPEGATEVIEAPETDDADTEDTEDTAAAVITEEAADAGIDAEALEAAKEEAGAAE